MQERVKILTKQIEEKKLIDDCKVNIIKDSERTIEDLKFKSNNLSNQLKMSKKTILDFNE